MRASGFSGTPVLAAQCRDENVFEHRAGKIVKTDLNAYATMRLDNVVY
ncbi:MAG: hypothetical protein ACI4JT_06610 [Oscillospiraceae bacterium]